MAMEPVTVLTVFPLRSDLCNLKHMIAVTLAGDNTASCELPISRSGERGAGGGLLKISRSRRTEGDPRFSRPSGDHGLVRFQPGFWQRQVRGRK
jgi:hypothetical protein